jgi:flagellar biosynthesis component FlhA
MIPSLVVLSYNEIPRETRVEAVGMVQYQGQPVGATGS